MPPVTIIMTPQRTGQKYLKSGMIFFQTRLLQVMSMALAIKNRPKVCLVFLSRINAARVAPMKPPSMQAYLCFSGSSLRLSPQTTVLNINKKAQMKRPNLMESLPMNPSTMALGDLIIFLMLKTVVIPALIKQLSIPALVEEAQPEQMHDPRCLQYGVRVNSRPSFLASLSVQYRQVKGIGDDEIVEAYSSGSISERIPISTLGICSRLSASMAYDHSSSSLVRQLSLLTKSMKPRYLFLAPRKSHSQQTRQIPKQPKKATSWHSQKMQILAYLFASNRLQFYKQVLRSVYWVFYSRQCPQKRSWSYWSVMFVRVGLLRMISLYRCTALLYMMLTQSWYLGSHSMNSHRYTQFTFWYRAPKPPNSAYLTSSKAITWLPSTSCWQFPQFSRNRLAGLSSDSMSRQETTVEEKAVERFSMVSRLFIDFVRDSWFVAVYDIRYAVIMDIVDSSDTVHIRISGFEAERIFCCFRWSQSCSLRYFSYIVLQGRVLFCCRGAGFKSLCYRLVLLIMLSSKNPRTEFSLAEKVDPISILLFPAPSLPWSPKSLSVTPPTALLRNSRIEFEKIAPALILLIKSTASNSKPLFLASSQSTAPQTRTSRTSTKILMASLMRLSSLTDQLTPRMQTSEQSLRAVPQIRSNICPMFRQIRLTSYRSLRQFVLKMFDNSYEINCFKGFGESSCWGQLVDGGEGPYVWLSNLVRYSFLACKSRHICSRSQCQQSNSLPFLTRKLPFFNIMPILFSSWQNQIKLTRSVLITLLSALMSSTRAMSTPCSTKAATNRAITSENARQVPRQVISCLTFYFQLKQSYRFVQKSQYFIGYFWWRRYQDRQSWNFDISLFLVMVCSSNDSSLLLHTQYKYSLSLFTLNTRQSTYQYQLPLLYRYFLCPTPFPLGCGRPPSAILLALILSWLVSWMGWSSKQSLQCTNWRGLRSIISAIVGPTSISCYYQDTKKQFVQLY